MNSNGNSMFLGKEIEITHINPEIKSIGILIHVYCSPNEITSPETQSKASILVNVGCKYLQDEGFIPSNSEGWLAHISGVAHTL